jgi:hypothetical protein
MSGFLNDPIPAGCYMTLALDDEQVVGRGVPYPGIPVPGVLLAYATPLGTGWEVVAVQVVLTANGSKGREAGGPLLADVIVRPAEGIYARYPTVEKT